MTNRALWKLVTVNTAPERAKRIVGRMIVALKDQYDIEHVDNCESEFSKGRFRGPSYANDTIAIDEVVPKVTKHRPNVLVSKTRQP